MIYYDIKGNEIEISDQEWMDMEEEITDEGMLNAVWEEWCLFEKDRG